MAPPTAVQYVNEVMALGVQDVSHRVPTPWIEPPMSAAMSGGDCNGAVDDARSSRLVASRPERCDADRPIPTRGTEPPDLIALATHPGHNAVTRFNGAYT